MIRTILYTDSGEAVTQELLPPFKTQPKIIIWGTRIFAWDKDNSQYMEAFAYAAFTESEMRNMGITPNN
jgi:hypothetical protein